MNKEIFSVIEKGEKGRKERVISFRVKDETYRSIENLAWEIGEKPNEWARKLVLTEAAKEVPMTAGERALFEEIARARFLLGNGFKLLAAGKLTDEVWRQVLQEAEKSSERIVEQLLAKKSRVVHREEEYVEPEPVH
jgi:hypothetical protein